MALAEGKWPSEPLTQRERGRAAALREEARRLREQSALLREQSDAVTGALVKTVLQADRAAPPQTGDTFTLRAGRVRPAVGLARGRLRNWLERSGVAAEDAVDIALACSEACANAVEHPVDPSRHVFEVEAKRTPTEVELVVRNFGRWREAHPGGHRGRGLHMIRELMDAAEIVTGENETALVMRRALPQQPTT